MTKKTIKASDVLGDNYYIYELTSSNYTPALNGSITITCTMKDVYGTAANGKSITLYQNGTSKGAQTTNSSGVATWSITCSNAGIQSFKVGNKAIEVFVDNKAISSHQHGNITSDGKLTTSHNGTYSTFVGVQDSTGTLYKASKINSDIIIDGTAHANIGSNANDNQSAINTAINIALGNKANSTHTHSDADITTVGFYSNLPQANYGSPSQQQVNFAINSAMGGKEDKSNKVTSLSENSTNTQYPSAKTVYDEYMNTKTVTPEMQSYGNTYTLNGVTKNFYHTGIDSEDLGYYDKIIYTITFNDNTFQMCNQRVPSMDGGVVVDTIYFDGSDCYWGGEWDSANQEYAKGNLICEGNTLQATLQGGVITINDVETNWEANGEITIFGNAIFSYTVYSYKYINTDYLNVYSNDTFNSYEQEEQSMNGETKMIWEHDFHSYRVPLNLSKVIYTITFNDNTFSYANPFKTIYFDGTDCYEGEWDYDGDGNEILVKGNLICEGNELQILYQDNYVHFPDGSSDYSNDILAYLFSFGEVVVKAKYIAPRFEYAQNKRQSLFSSYYDESIVYPSVSAVKNYAENKSNKTSSWNSTTDNTRYPTEKLVKDSLDGKEDKTNKVTSISSSSTNTQYPSAKCVYDIFTNTSPILCNLLSNVISYGENNDPDW